MTPSLSLRGRLTLIILCPLIVISVLIGWWQWRDARAQAAELFDKRLLVTAVAISADVARSGGDALSLRTRDLLTDTSGGRVYYHAYAPDGVYVTGFATPPVPPTRREIGAEPVVFYNGVYHGQPVRVLRLVDVTSVGGFSGSFTYTVWQELAVRDALLRDMTLRVFTAISAMILTVALVVWFGVRFGLRPLTDLEDAISRRSSDDLTPIRRVVPPETRGLVERLNTLFRQVDGTMQAQASFISNAAHQLRNPIAGILALGEAVKSAPNQQAARTRADDLLRAARHAKDLANKLLTLERASASPGLAERVEVSVEVAEVAQSFQSEATAAGVSLRVDLPGAPVYVLADPVMLREALANLIDNALKHGGAALSQIAVTVALGKTHVGITVSDDGIGIPQDDIETVLARFGQRGESQGSGLGLSIAEAVALAQNGKLSLVPGKAGLAVTLHLPVVTPDRA